MAFIRYISDNPYRLLDVGSAINHKELRQRANAAAQSAKVGLPAEAGLEQLFGAEEMPRCPDIVRSLTTDPARRTIYRLFWPFRYEQSSRGDGTLRDIDHLLSTCPEEERFLTAHLRFLRAWFQFEATAQPEAVHLALGAFLDLYNDPECDRYLTQLLQSEGEGERQAIDSVYRAQEVVIEHLLSSVCHRAADLWRAADVTRCVAILKAASESGYADDHLGKALGEIVRLGNQEMARIRSDIEEFEGWLPRESIYNAEEDEKLLQLGRVLQHRLPEASQWVETVEKRIEQVAGAMYECALELAHQRLYGEARKVLLKAQSLPLSEEQSRQIETEMARIDESQTRRRDEAVERRCVRLGKLFVRYLTDNPYRLLGIGSSVPHRELRQKANAVVKAASAGLPPEVALEALLGADELGRCAEIVSSLAHDAKQRTLYRLFWPLEYTRLDCPDGQLKDLEHLSPLCSNSDSFQATQLRFLRSWLEFATTSTPSALQLALGAFADLYMDTDCDTYLVRLLQSEGECEEWAYECLDRAQDEVIEHLLVSACRRAVEIWEAGSVDPAVLLLGAVRESRFEDDQIDRALQAVVDAGNREMHRIRDLGRAFQGWTPEQGELVAQEVGKLHQLAQAVQGRLSAAELWLRAIEDRVGPVACSMRSHAIDLANEQSDYAGARSILLQAQALPLPQAVREKIEHDLCQLGQLEEEERLWKDVRPTSGAPILATINGIGFKL
jgi:hypothetical protein